MGQRRGHAVLVAVGVAGSAGFGALAVRGVDLGLFWSSMTEMEYVWLVPALITLGITVFIRAQRWRLMFVPQSRPATRPALRSLLIGLFFNQILPLRAGEAIRVVTLKQEAGTSRAEAAGTAIVERLYDVLALLLILFVAWTFGPPVSWIHAAAIFALVFSVVLAGVIAALVVFGASALKRALAPFAILPRITRERADSAAAHLSYGLEALHRPSLAAGGFLMTVLSWLAAAVSYFCVLRGFDLGTDFAAGMIVLVATNLALVIPSLPAGVGVFEAATIVALQPYSVDDSKALACAIVLHAVNFFPYLAAGVFALHSHALLLRRRASLGAAGLRSEPPI